MSERANHLSACAAAEAQAFLCEADDAMATAEVATSALAVSWAQATAAWFADCDSFGDGGACIFLEGEVEAQATAFADSFATAWAMAGDACDCTVNVLTEVETLSDVLASVVVAENESFCVQRALLPLPCAASLCVTAETCEARMP